MKLSIKATAVTLGLVMGPGLFLKTWWIILLGDGASMTPAASLEYRGYEISPVGSLYGLLWGFVDGCILGGIVAWIYNKLVEGPLGR